jgi:uncharacterized membrane protein
MMLKKISSATLQGFFWILPIAIIIILGNWVLETTQTLTAKLFAIFGLHVENYPFIWMVLGILLMLLTLFIIGSAIQTRLVGTLDKLIKKIPFYTSIMDIVGIFNTSKSKNNVLVVAIKGFTQNGYNIGLMYSTKESVLKNHYTVTLSMSPIPNGGFMFEVHRDDILVIKNAGFNENLNYLLSMGTKSLAEILDTQPQENLPTFTQWQKEESTTNQ